MSASEYDDRTALLLAAICSQAYAQFNDPGGDFVIPHDFKLAASFRAKSATGQSEKFGFILESTDRVVIAFRGTSTTADWISDAIASQGKFKCVPHSGQTHLGISHIYYSAREAILRTLTKLPSNKTLMITGHSLGGALAVLCGLDVAANSRFKPIVYTYGSPRVGDPVFAKAFSTAIDGSYRVNNRFDVVTHLPPQIYKLPNRDKTYHYMHVQQDISIPFHYGSVSANHVISSYFEQLAQREPDYAQQLCDRNLGLCPTQLGE